MNDIFLLNFMPNYCPLYSTELTMTSPESLYDFYGSASHTCQRCGAKFCFVDTDLLLEAADKSGSDLPDRVKGN